MSDQLLMYDRDCGLCRTIVAAALMLDRAGRLQPLALQSTEAERLLAEISPAERLASFHLLDRATGGVSSAGAGLAELAALLPGGRVTGAALRAAPFVSDRAYRLVAEHRQRIGRLIPAAIKAKATRRIDRAGSPS